MSEEDSAYEIVEIIEYGNGVCSHCELWSRGSIYEVTVKNKYNCDIHRICYGCFEWLYKHYKLKY